MSDQPATLLDRLYALSRCVSIDLSTCREAADALDARDAEIAGLRGALVEIHTWAESYPDTVFTEPDFERMQRVLEAAGMPTAMDAAHGTWARHLMKNVGRIAREALGNIS
jgi:hypothetical protein